MAAPIYRICELFVIRPTGVDYDALDELACPRSIEIARELLRLQASIDALASRSLAILKEEPSLLDDLGKKSKARLRKDLVRRRPLSDDVDPIPEIEEYRAVGARIGPLEAELARTLEEEQGAASEALRASCARVLPHYAVIQSLGPAVRRMLGHRSSKPFKERDKDRRLALYMQRLCAKNDTFGRFGPSGWGRVDRSRRGLVIEPEAKEESRRSASVERWVALALAELVNADPEARQQIRPRLHPDVELDGTEIFDHRTSRSIELTADERRVLEDLAGSTGSDAAIIENLSERDLVIWRQELIPWDPDPLRTFADDVSSWEDGPAKQRWSDVARGLLGFVDELLVTEAPEEREQIITGLQTRLEELGAVRPERTRTLYAATNVLVEESYRDCGLVVGGDVIERLEADAAPWFQLFQDVYSLASSRAYKKLGALMESAPRRKGRLSLASLMAHAREQGFAIDGGGMSSIGAEAFGDAKRVLREALSDRSDAPEWEIGPEECGAVRRAFEFPDVREPAGLCADVQIAASSVDDVDRGDYRLVISETNHIVLPFLHSFFWSCPDPGFISNFVSSAGSKYLVHDHEHFYGPVHTSKAFMEAFTDSCFVSSARARQGWKVARPADTEVVAIDEAHDIRVRSVDGEDLGSLVHTFWTYVGYHPFFPVSIEPHTPRLVRGKTVLQRATWYVRDEELEAGSDGVTPELLVAIERLRARRDIPRWVFIRPAVGTLEHSNIDARDKDLKPIFVDLESYVFCEIFARKLRDYKYLQVVEMLPSPDQLLWRDASGRRCFEMRAMFRDPASR